MDLLEWFEKKSNTTNQRLSEKKYYDALFVGTVCLITLIVGILYAALSKTVYFWDDATYWEIGRDLAEKKIGFDFFKEIYTSIGTSDYNLVPAFLVSLWMKVFGITRVSYIACIITLYLIPWQIAVFYTAKEISKAPRTSFLISILSMPAVMYIVSIGFVDICGVLVGTLCYYIYFKKKPEKNTWLYYVVLGILLTDIMVLRRYFAFFSVSFITAMIIDAIMFKADKKNIIITVLTAGIVLVTAFYPFLRNILLKDYGTLYSGYKYDVFTDLKLITRYFGLLFILTVLACGPVSAVKKKDMRGVFTLIQLLVCFFMFIFTQTHGQQHLLLYVPGFVILILLGINTIKKQWVLVVAAVLTAVNLFSPCINRVQPQNIQEIKGLSLIPSYSVRPKKRDDVYELLTLRRKLDKAIPEGSKCGIIASSFAVNSSILENVVPSMNIKSERDDRYIIGMPEVDSRDFWRLNEIYDSEYLLVATPAQLHLKESEQTIVTETVSSFKNNTDIANAFVKEENFKYTIGDIDFMLYKRHRDVTLTEKTEFELRLYK